MGKDLCQAFTSDSYEPNALIFRELAIATRLYILPKGAYRLAKESQSKVSGLWAGMDEVRTALAVGLEMNKMKIPSLSKVRVRRVKKEGEDKDDEDFTVLLKESIWFSEASLFTEIAHSRTLI